jgi:hypothetical protein
MIMDKDLENEYSKIIYFINSNVCVCEGFNGKDKIIEFVTNMYNFAKNKEIDCEYYMSVIRKYENCFKEIEKENSELTIRYNQCMNDIYEKDKFYENEINVRIADVHHHYNDITNNLKEEIKNRKYQIDNLNHLINISDIEKEEL